LVSVRMVGNNAITATLAINTYSLSVRTAGSGTVAKSPNQASYNYGTVVQLTATPSTGWHFVGWSGDTSGSANPLSVTMDRNKSMTATFATSSYTLADTAVGRGAVSVSPNQASYNHGTVVQLTATPAAGWQFTGWSGDTSGTANPISMTMDRNKSVTATFYSSGFTLAYTVVGRGAVSVSPDQESYANGT